MEKEDEQKLYAEFPQLYRDAKRPNSIMSYGLACDLGWFPLLYELSLAICLIAEKENLQGDWYPKFVQVKEKMGSGRFYLRVGPEDDGGSSPRLLAAAAQIQALCREAENMTMTICEICGKPGKLYRDNWWRVRCDKCEGRKK
jgi:hypothetical protein